VVEFTFRIFPNLKNYRVQAVPDPTDGAMLIGEIRTLIGVIRMKENLLHFLKADSALGVPPKTIALPRIEMESHKV
jgi:hypothetical protein